MAPRLSLLGKFVVLSLLATVLLAVAVGSVLHERIERRALDNAERLTRVIGDLTIAPRLTETQLEGDLRRPVLDSLDASIARVSTGEGAVRHVNLFTPDGRRVYSDDRDKIEPVTFSRNVYDAFAGTTRSEVERVRDDGREAEEATL